jgi:hypothetical protein
MAHFRDISDTNATLGNLMPGSERKSNHSVTLGSIPNSGAPLARVMAGKGGFQVQVSRSSNRRQ